MGWVVSGEARAAEQAEDGGQGSTATFPTSSPLQLGSFWFSHHARHIPPGHTAPRVTRGSSDHPSNTLQSAQDPLQPLTLGLTAPPSKSHVVLGP